MGTLSRCERFESLSVDPIFPNLFRYRYGMDINVDLAKSLHDEAAASGLVTKMMTNPDFRVDYGTIVSSHMLRPEWDKKLVVMSSNRSCSYYSVEVMMEQSIALGARAVRPLKPVVTEWSWFPVIRCRIVTLQR